MEPAPSSGPPRTGLDKFFAESLAFDPNLRPATPDAWREALRGAVVAELSAGFGVGSGSGRRGSRQVSRRAAILAAMGVVLAALIVASLLVVGGGAGNGVPELDAVGSGPGGADAVGLSPDGGVSSIDSVRSAQAVYAAPSADVSGVQPQGLARLSDGSTVVARPAEHVVVRITGEGSVEPFAGTGKSGAATEGVAATSSDLQQPTGLAAGSGGELYISDPAAHVVLRVEASGVITRFAGTGSAGSDGDGGSATDAQLSGPLGLAAGGDGSLYVADKAANRVRKIDPQGSISTVTGTGDSGAGTDQLSAPVAVVVDSDGGVVIADAGNDRLVIVSGSSSKTKSETGAVALTRAGSDVLVLHGKPGSYKLRTVGT